MSPRIVFKSEDEMPEMSMSLTLMDWNRTGSWRYLRPVYRDKTPPCNEGCPAGNDIEGMMVLMAEGRVQEALDRLLLDTPFPATMGRICYHPCMERCNRGQFDEAVRIKWVERFAGDAGLEAGSFDAVVMRDVLEHVRDPRGFLQAARHVLRPDGILALSMPNFASLNALLGGPAWRHLHPEQHLFQFAPRTIDRLLDKCGFEAIEMTSRYDSPATREVYAALTAPAERRRLALHAALRGDIVFLPLGTTLRRLLRAAAVGLSLAALPFRDRLSDDILEVHARRLST